jgi:hypothetical protein
MATTYEKIATTTLTGSQANITFSSISSSYTDLRLVVSCLLTATQDVYLRINGDTGSNYANTVLKGYSAAVSTSRQTSQTWIFLDESQTSIPTFYEIDFFSYSGSTLKPGLISCYADRADAQSRVEKKSFLWSSTSAITSVTIVPNVTTLAAGTTATLYGILKA